MESLFCICILYRSPFFIFYVFSVIKTFLKKSALPFKIWTMEGRIGFHTKYYYLLLFLFHSIYYLIIRNKYLTTDE